MFQATLELASLRVLAESRAAVFFCVLFCFAFFINKHSRSSDPALIHLYCLDVDLEYLNCSSLLRLQVSGVKI